MMREQSGEKAPHGQRITWLGNYMMSRIHGEEIIFMVDSRHSNNSVTTTKVDQRITVTYDSGWCYDSG